MNLAGSARKMLQTNQNHPNIEVLQPKKSIKAQTKSYHTFVCDLISSEIYLLIKKGWPTHVNISNRNIPTLSHEPAHSLDTHS
jgi:hypothetical protein